MSSSLLIPYVVFLFFFLSISSDSLKDLLLYTFASPNYLQSPDGRRFLTFVMGLNVGLIESIHEVIKTQVA